MLPLEGVKVLDFTQFLSGPFTTMLLGDLGADVIKIEKPDGGEIYRSYGPKFINGESTSFLSANRNKRSLTINMKSAESRDVLRRLVEKADILVENFKPGTMKKLGLDYETASRINPRLVYCSISGYGQTGPYRNRGGFDLVAQAMSGMMSVTGEPGRPPVKVGYPVADMGAGMYAAIGILAAYIGAQRTGKGQWVDASLLEAALSWALLPAGNYYVDGEIPGPLGSASPQNAPYQGFTTKDGAFVVGTGNDELWVRFCEIFGLEHLARDPRYSTNALRVKNQFELAEAIQAEIGKWRTEDCLSRLNEDGIPCGPIYRLDEALKDPQVVDRGMVVEMDHPVAGKVKTLGMPVKLSENPFQVRRHPPRLGEHNEEILRELGFSEAEVSWFKSNKVI